MTTLERAVRFLNPKRQRYAFWFGGALWLAWLVSLALGPGLFDRAGQVLGTDYLEFYSAGQTVLRGESARLYDFAYQFELQKAIIGPQLTTFYANLTPPFLAWLYAALAWLPYPLSFAAWCLAGFAWLYAALALLGLANRRQRFWWALCWFPVYANFPFGQNGLLSLFLLALVYFLWQRDKSFLAGLAASLLLFKPQLLLGLGIWWLLEWRLAWKTWLGLLLGGVVLVGLSVGLMPAASQAYVDVARQVLPSIDAWPGFPTWHSVRLRSFFGLLLPGLPRLADGLAVLTGLAGLAGFIRLWRRWRAEGRLMFALAILLTFLISPHAMIYDWAVLLIPAWLLWDLLPNLRKQWIVLYAALFMVTMISGPLAFYQRNALGIAIQLSTLVYWLACYQIYRTLGGDLAGSPAVPQNT